MWYINEQYYCVIVCTVICVKYISILCAITSCCLLNLGDYKRGY